MNEQIPRPDTAARTRKTARLPLIALAALPLTVGVVLAQQSTSGTAAAPTAQAQRVQPVQPGQTPTTPVQPGQAAPRPVSGTNYADVFLQNLAAQLGITTAKLKSAAIAAGSATIDQGVKAGDVPSDRAAEMKQRLEQNPFAIGGGRGGPGGHGGHGPGMGRHGGPDGPDGRGPDSPHAPDPQGAPDAPAGTTSGTSGT
ncbi:MULTISPECIES: hypothetical protein [Deinococcus]|uniref:Translation initiation factor IF-2 n=1 Tax=Deinococcus rufus TaxID=2136097 RepID=A0ABV7ZAR8_9DEIO|nr:hypothetical protein [Deinococcus sp. AB2017081]WQE94340.1 hypothetical protein U2P90_13085 [Deinococcus sp. AB2017081]